MFEQLLTSTEIQLIVSGGQNCGLGVAYVLFRFVFMIIHAFGDRFHKVEN